MIVVVNGERLALPDSASVQDLVVQMNLAGQRIAVEVNRHIVPRSTHGDTKLGDGDRIEIVHAIGGG